MTELLALSPIDVLAKLGPTGMVLILSFYLLRWFDDRVFKRVTVREQRVDGSTDKLINGTLGWAEDMQAWAKGVSADLADCKAHHAQCTEELAVLRAQAQNEGRIRQETQKAIAANKLAERERES